MAAVTSCENALYVLHIVERVSMDCRKTKTKVITLANQKERRQSSKPSKTRSNYRKPMQSAGKCARASHEPHGFRFTSDCLKKWRENFEPITE